MKRYISTHVHNTTCIRTMSRKIHYFLPFLCFAKNQVIVFVQNKDLNIQNAFFKKRTCKKTFHEYNRIVTVK